MSAPETISEAITQAALGPKRSKENGREVEEHAMDQLIKADNHVSGKTAGRKNHMGLRFGKIVPPGAG
jgi:hypothetical protein